MGAELSPEPPSVSFTKGQRATLNKGKGRHPSGQRAAPNAPAPQRTQSKFPAPPPPKVDEFTTVVEGFTKALIEILEQNKAILAYLRDEVEFDGDQPLTPPNGRIREGNVLKFPGQMSFDDLT